MAETITLSVTGGGTFTLFEQPLRASVAAPVFDIELSESVEAIGKVVQSRAFAITGQSETQFGPDASALVTRSAQIDVDSDFFVSGVEIQSREVRFVHTGAAQFLGAEIKSRFTGIESEVTLDIQKAETSPIESRRVMVTTDAAINPVDTSTRSGEFDIATATAVEARGVTVEARDAQITGVFSTQFERETTPPEVTASNYNSGTKTLTTSITEESSQVIVYWASVANPNIVTDDDIRDNTGDTIEVGSFVALSGDDSNTITLTDPTADEIHFFTVDALGNQQVDIEIVTGIVVDDLQSREIQATSAAALNAVGAQVEARDAQIAGSAVLDMEGSDAALDAAEALFQASEPGIIVDPTDISLFYQDLAGISPVTADGQTILRIEDKLGRGFRIEQLTNTGTPRMTYRDDGTYQWIAVTDGTGEIATVSDVVPGTDKAQIFLGVRKLNDTASQSLCSNGKPAIQMSRLQMGSSITTGSTGGTGDTWFTTSRGDGPDQSAYSHAPYDAPITSFLTGLFDNSAVGNKSSLRVNGSAVAPSGSITGTFGSGNFATAPIGLFATDGGTSALFSGNLYYCVFRFGPEPSAQEISDLETLIAANTP